MIITKIDSVTCAQLLSAKKKAIGTEMVLRRSFDPDNMPPMSEDLEAVSKLADLSEVFVLSGFAGRGDMDTIALNYFNAFARNQLIRTIIVQSTEENCQLDAELSTIEQIRKASHSFHQVTLDSTDPDQAPLFIFGVIGDEELQYRSSPDYAVDIVNAAQERMRRKAAEEQAQRAAQPAPPVLRGMWRVA